MVPLFGWVLEEKKLFFADADPQWQAHIKSALIGASVTIPIKDGKLATGTWQVRF